MRMRSGEKGEVFGQTRKCKALNEKACVVKPFRACLWRNGFLVWLCKAPHDFGVCWKQFMMLLEEVLVCGGVSFQPPCTSRGVDEGIHVRVTRRRSARVASGLPYLRSSQVKCPIPTSQSSKSSQRSSSKNFKCACDVFSGNKNHRS